MTVNPFAGQLQSLLAELPPKTRDYQRLGVVAWLKPEDQQRLIARGDCVVMSRDYVEAIIDLLD